MTNGNIILINYELDLIEKVERAGKGDQYWCEKKFELSRRTRQAQAALKHRQLKDRMLDFKNCLYILNNSELKTESSKGCHDSQVA